MAYKTITAGEAAELLAATPGALYIDVRSTGEFAAGHPAGAVNVPIAEPDPRTGQMAFNPDFQAVVEKTAPKEAVLVLGCQSGKRSEMACRVLEGAGFTNLANLAGGFGGMRDPMGQTLQPGWRDSGLPVSTENGEGVSYESLKRKALGG